MRLLLNVACSFAMFYYFCTIYLLQFAMLYHWNTPCVSILVSIHNWLWCNSSSWAGSTPAFSYVYWRASETGSMSIRTWKAHLVQSHWCTFNVDHFHDPILFFTTLSFIEQLSHKDARYVSRFKAFASEAKKTKTSRGYFIGHYFMPS